MGPYQIQNVGNWLLFRKKPENIMKITNITAAELICYQKKKKKQQMSEVKRKLCKRKRRGSAY
jgi:hypothetical protein